MDQVAFFDHARTMAEINHRIACASAARQTIPARLQAKDILRRHPDCEMSEDDIVEATLRMAVWRALPVDTAY